MRLYFTEFASKAAGPDIRPLQFLAVIGAAVIATAMVVLYGLAPWRAALWCGAVALGETGVVVINNFYRRRPPPEETLRAWALGKAAIALFGGLSWSLSQPLLHVPGEPIATIVPAWMILTYCCGAVWAGAFYEPALLAMLLGSTLPAGLWLVTLGGFERSIGFSLLATVPMLLAIGAQAAKRYRSAVNDKLEIGLLLERQSAYTQRIEQLGSERRRFFSAASHDLRQPLHAMGLYLSLLRDETDADERRRLIESLSQCAYSLDSQFSAIMGVGETDRFIERAAPRPTPLQLVLDRMAAQARPRAEAAELRFLSPATGLWADVAPEALERVLVNLALNAVRYTRDGGLLVGARPKGNQVQVLVADTGVGVAPEHQARIFEDFFQVANPGRDRDKGFGLGLGIVRRLCEGMGWPIDLRSRPGRGSVFAVTVPRAAPQVATPAPFVQEPGPLLRARAVLVVDDDPYVRDAMQRLFARWKVEAIFCASPDEALAALAAAPPDRAWRMLADYRLGGAVDGLALAARVRALYGDRVTTTLITGEADEALDAQAQACGLVVLRKPIQTVRLRALLTS